jgi:hypothetical protein
LSRKNPFWLPIKSLVDDARRKTLFILVVVTLGLPIAEGVLTEIWSSAPVDAKAVPGWTLAVVAVIHIVLGIFLIWDQLTMQPHAVLAKAFEAQELASSQQAELKRRKTTYSLVRSAFDRLNLETCNIEYDPGSDAWCLGGFQGGLEPILAPSIEEADTALGVVSKHFTLEAFFEPGRVPVRGNILIVEKRMAAIGSWGLPELRHAVAVS